MKKSSEYFEQLVKEHMVYATCIAKQFKKERKNSGIDEADFISAAFVGLVEAAKRFDPEKGIAFQSFAYLRIKGSLYDLLQRSVGISRSQYVLLKKAKEEQMRERTESEEGGNKKRFCAFITTRALLDSLGYSVLDGRIDSETEVTYLEQNTPETHAIRKSARSYLSKLIETLPGEERDLIRMKYFEDRDQHEVSEYFGRVSRSWVSRVHLKALDTLKDKVMEDQVRVSLKQAAA